MKYHNLPASSFPFTVEGVLPEGDVIWRHTVHAGEAVHVPPFARRFGRPVMIRSIWPDGRIVEVNPDGSGRELRPIKDDEEPT
jgi:hypothetical protein